MMHLYSAFIVYCHTPKALYNHVGGGGVSPQPPPVCSIHLDDATAATGQRRQCDIAGDYFQALRHIAPAALMVSSKFRQS